MKGEIKMSKMKDFRMFIAEDFVKKNNGLIDLDEGFVLADELWDKACKKDKKATAKLGGLVRRYRNQKEQA